MSLNRLNKMQEDLEPDNQPKELTGFDAQNMKRIIDILDDVDKRKARLEYIEDMYIEGLQGEEIELARNAIFRFHIEHIKGDGATIKHYADGLTDRGIDYRQYLDGRDGDYRYLMKGQVNN